MPPVINRDSTFLLRFDMSSLFMYLALKLSGKKPILSANVTSLAFARKEVLSP